MPRNVEYGDTDVGEDVPTSASKGKSRKPSKHIGKRQATNMIAALKFAETIGLPLNISVDISWIFFSGSADDRTRFARLQQRLSKWALRRGFPITMIWTRELGKNGGIHTHVLVHVPPPLSQDGTFQRTLEHSLEPEGGPRHDKAILIQTAYAPLGKLCYNLKGIGPKHANEFGIRPAYQGELSGKRAGLTENLGAGARRKAATATREVGQPSSCTSKKSLQTWTVSANSEPAAARGQTLASKFSSRDAHEASPARDRGGDAKPPNNEKNGELGAGPSVRQPLF